jgi:hypothetical protein
MNRTSSSQMRTNEHEELKNNIEVVGAVWEFLAVPTNKIA